MISWRVNDLLLDPFVSDRQAFLESHFRLPTWKNFPRQRVVGIAATHALGSSHMLERNRILGNLHEHRSQFVHADRVIVADVHGSAIIRSYERFERFHDIGDVNKRAPLLAVAPNFDFFLAFKFGYSNLSSESRRCLLSAALPGFFRPINVVKTRDARLQAVVFLVVLAELFDREFPPAIGRFWKRRINLRLLERCGVWFLLVIF